MLLAGEKIPLDYPPDLLPWLQLGGEPDSELIERVFTTVSLTSFRGPARADVQSEFRLRYEHARSVLDSMIRAEKGEGW